MNLPRLTRLVQLLCGVLVLAISVIADGLCDEPLVVRVTDWPGPNADGFHMGRASNPEGHSIGINNRYLTRDAKPWMPVMGEFHYARCPQEEWREELLRIKAGGVDIVASYVFWIHHEEVEGEWDWSGRRDLREFVRLCGDVGLLASIRIGPWCHGEVRNGGIPDWAIDKPWRLRTNDPAYLEQVEVLYGQIAAQLDGLLWKDGGPVVAIQLENEYRGRAEHLLTLKRIARDVGLDVPLYTRTGWPNLGSKMPFGEIAPLYGAYAEGFWDRTLRSMPGKYWAAFRFMHVRTDAAIATEQLGERAIRDEPSAAEYPFLTCELGGGMMSSFHRRISMQPEDIESVALTKVGSGGNLPGYYMYHGGVNPDGRLSTLMEDQSTRMTNYNDMPVKNYDFQAPLGAFGQTRPHYHWLRRIHLLFRDFGDRIARMPSFLPEQLPGDKSDTKTVRWAVRADDTGGFLFVNNHQRAAKMGRHEGVRFAVESTSGRTVFPDLPVTIEPGAMFVWPFDLDLGDGVILRYATAQLICEIEDGNERTVFFAETPGVPATFAFEGHEPTTLSPGRSVAMRVSGHDHDLQVVLLSEADSLGLWKGQLVGRERAVLSRADVTLDGAQLGLRWEGTEPPKALVFPPIDGPAATDGVFAPVQLPKSPADEIAIWTKQLQPAGPPPTVEIGSRGVAKQPTDDDFANAALWQVGFVEDFDPAESDALLRIRYHGDAARVMVGERLVIDDFYNGKVLEVGLRRYATELSAGEPLTVAIMPTTNSSNVAYPTHIRSAGIASLESVETIPRRHLVFRQSSHVAPTNRRSD